MSTNVRPLYVLIACAIDARQHIINSKENGRLDANEWIDRWENRIEKISKNLLPSGSGFDAGTQIDIDSSNGNKLVISTAFHHMDENGGYTRWTYHTITVTPHLASGFNMRISGPDCNGIKSYIAESFENALNEKTDWVLITDD